MRVTTLHVEVFIPDIAIRVFFLIRGKLEAPPSETLVDGDKAGESTNLWASKPPVACISREGRVGAINGELPVVKPPILALLKEVRSSIVPLQRSIDSTERNILTTHLTPRSSSCAMMHWHKKIQLARNALVPGQIP